MKCSSCGQEFGNGANCQSCGIDRVSGLGDYSGFNAPVTSGVGVTQPVYYQQEGNKICPFCQEIIPMDADYCPFCSKKLEVECPSCGHVYSAHFPACPKCGINREHFLREKKEKEERLKREEEARQERLRMAEKERQEQLKREEEARKEAEMEAARRRAAIEAEGRKKKIKELESEDKWDWLNSTEGEKWLSFNGGDWARTPAGEKWIIKTASGRNWFLNKCKDWQCGSWCSMVVDVKDYWPWLETKCGRRWLNSQFGYRWLQTERGYEWLVTNEGAAWRDNNSGNRDLSFFYSKWMTSEEGKQWMNHPVFGLWLTGKEGRSWLESADGRRWKQTDAGKKWSDFQNEKVRLRKFIKTREGREWLSSSETEKWLIKNDVYLPLVLNPDLSPEWKLAINAHWIKTKAGNDFLFKEGVKECDYEIEKQVLFSYIKHYLKKRTIKLYFEKYSWKLLLYYVIIGFIGFTVIPSGGISSMLCGCLAGIVCYHVGHLITGDFAQLLQCAPKGKIVISGGWIYVIVFAGTVLGSVVRSLVEWLLDWSIRLCGGDALGEYVVGSGGEALGNPLWWIIGGCACVVCFLFIIGRKHRKNAQSINE